MAGAIFSRSNPRSLKAPEQNLVPVWLDSQLFVYLLLGTACRSWCALGCVDQTLCGLTSLYSVVAMSCPDRSLCLRSHCRCKDSHQQSPGRVPEPPADSRGSSDCGVHHPLHCESEAGRCLLRHCPPSGCCVTSSCCSVASAGLEPFYILWSEGVQVFVLLLWLRGPECNPQLL